MSVRDRLEGKASRHVEVRVQITDPGPALDAAAAAQTLLLAAQADPARAGEVPALAQAAAAAFAAVDDHYELVGFTALPPDVFEDLVAQHTTPDGVPDRDRLLVILAAACADDPDLRDEDWWTGQLFAKHSAWTPGERDQLYYRLFTELHYTVPAGGLGKG